MDKLKFSDESNKRTKQSEERLLALMKATSDVIYRMSPDWKTMTELYGRGFLADTKEDDPDWLDKYIHPEDQKFVTGVIDECIRKKKIFELEHRVLRANGSMGWTFSRAVPILDETGVITEWFGAASDITERKEAEEALRELTRQMGDANRQKEDILESISDCFYALDKDLRFTYVNKAAEEIWGLSRADLIGRSIEEVFPNLIDISLSKFRRVLEEQVPQYYEVYSKVIGRWGDMSVYPTKDGISVYFHDITERKNTEEALRKSERNLQSVLDNTKDVTVRVDRDLRFLLVNRAGNRFTGLPSEDIVGRTNKELGMPSELCDVWESHYRRVFQTGKTEQLEFTASGPEGMKHYLGTITPEFDENGAVATVLGVSVDITERKRAEEELFFQAHIFSSMQDAICAVDENFYITYWNEVAEKMFGWTAREVIGRLSKDIFRMVSPSSRDESIANLIRNNGYKGEAVYKKKDGKEIHTNVVCSVIRNTHGEYKGNVSTFSDITEHKRAEEALAAERKRLFDVMETLPVMICLITPDYHIPFANKAFREKFGESEGRRCYDYICGLTEPCAFCEALKPLKTGKPHHWEFTSPDGSTIIDAYDFPFSDTDGSPLILEMDIDITERKMTEEALRERESRLQAVLNSLPAAVLITDPAGQMIDANRALQEVWGENAPLTAPELYVEYRGWWPETGKRLEAHEWPLAKSVQGETVRNAVIEIESFDGKRKFIRADSSPIIGPRGENYGAVAINEDITEQKLAEDALKALSNDLAAEVNTLNALHGISSQFIKKADAGAVYKEILDAVIFLTGADCGNIQMVTDEGKTLEIVTHNGYSDEFVTRYKRISGERTVCLKAKEDGTRTIEEDMPNSEIFGEEDRSFLRKEGLICVQSTPMFSTAGNLQGIMSTHYKSPHKFSERELRLIDLLSHQAADVIERVRIEGALRESEEKYRELVENSPAGIYEIDFRTGRYTSVNDAMCIITGYSREELLNMSPFDLLDKEGAVRFQKRLKQWLSGEKPEENVDYTIITKDGRELTALLNAKFTRDEKGDPLGASVIGYDITERKKAEGALRESEKKAIALVAELEQADRNKNQFISVLSHELRNPLAAISAGIQILDITRDIGETEKAKEIVKRQMNQLCKLVDDLLEMTRISQNKIKLKKENIDLNEIIKSAAEDLRPEFANKGVKLETEIQKRPVIMSADPVRVTQAIGNLLSNALKFTHSNGAVRLTLKRDKDYAVISVRDNGIGISPETLKNLFSPFTQADSTTDRYGGGLGLGLSIVKGIVDLHEGSVHVNSDGLGKGSEFKIRLPIIMGEKPIMEKAVKSKAAKKALNLLIIDDNRDFTDLLSTMLCAAGYKVNIAYDGTDGLKMVKQIKPDVIFCDIGLPGMNGYEVAKKIRSDSELEGIKLIALTGYAVEGDVERALKAGFDKHMAKPVDFASLKYVLEQ